MNIPGGDASSPGLDIDLAAEVVEVPDKIRKYFRALMLETFMSTPEEHVTWIIDRVARQGIPVSVEQVLGFSRYTAQVASPVQTEETTTSTTYGNLATTGAELTGLPDGTYAFAYGATVKSSGTGLFAVASLKINGDEATDADCIQTNATTSSSLFRVVEKTLAGGNNTVTMRYRITSAGTGTFSHRNLTAFRVSN